MYGSITSTGGTGPEGSYLIGDPVTYTISTQNIGYSTVTNVKVTDIDLSGEIETPRTLINLTNDVGLLSPAPTRR